MLKKLRNILLLSIQIIFLIYFLILIFLYLYQRNLMYHPNENNYFGDQLSVSINKVKVSTKDNIEKALSQLRPPIFWKDKPTFILQAKKWNLEKIKDILDKTYDLEFKMKTNPSLNKNILLKKLIVDICEKASA